MLTLTLFQQRQQREREAKARNVARLLDSAKALLRRADDEDGRDLTEAEQRQGAALLARADRIVETLDDD